MPDALTLPEPPYLAKTVREALEDKAALNNASRIILGLLAGIYIGFGGIFALIGLAGAKAIPYGIGQTLAGLVFALGLVLVVVAGAELFTGNTLMLGSVAAGRLDAGKAAAALAVVYAANFLGSVLLVLLTLASGFHEAGEGAIAQAALELGAEKTTKGFTALIASGVLANMLVCTAVWMAYGGQTVTQKLAAVILLIAAFVAAGFEHSVANMFLLPYAWLIQFATGAATQITVIGIASNLVAVTLGNLAGGALIALAYHHAYLKN